MFAGIILTLAVGVLWSFVGVFFKAMAKWKLSVYNISLTTSLFTFIILTCFVTQTKELLNGTITPPDIFYAVFVAASGFINMSGSLLLQRSMVYGKSQVTWAIGQSALIIPFISITLFYSEPWSVMKIGGSVCVLAGMAVLAMKRSGSDDLNASDPKRGILLALSAFLVLGAAQSMTGATGHFQYQDAAATRPILMLCGSLMALVAGKIIMRDRGFALNRKSILIIVLMAAQNAAAFAMQFKALDILSKYDMAAVFYPVAVGTCIAGYSIWSLIFMHEKANRYVTGGTIVILTGIFLYCLAQQ